MGCQSPNATLAASQNITLAKCNEGKSGKIQAGVCLPLESFKVRDCRSPEDFETTLSSFLNDYLRTFMVAVFGVAGVQFVGFVIACAFVCTRYTGGDNQVYAA